MNLRNLSVRDAERALAGAGFERIRDRGSHRIWGRGAERVVVPAPSNANGGRLAPWIAKAVLSAVGAR